MPCLVIVIIFKHFFLWLTVLLLAACHYQAPFAGENTVTKNQGADIHLGAPKLAIENKKGSPLVFATPHQLNISLVDGGHWRSSDGAVIWEFKVSADALSSFNFAFRDVKLSTHARLEILNEKDESVGGVYTHQDNKPHGQLWTGQVNGYSALIRLSMPEKEKSENKLVLWKINQGIGR